MSDVWFYLLMGWQHIISFNALDHQLFIAAFTVLYTAKEWKKVLLLVTAFTIGHSITLALSTLNILTVPAKLVEFLIPCTIVITAIANMAKPSVANKNISLNYFLAIFFGLVHGLGFANALKFMLAHDQSLGWCLLSFNVGLEVGQIIVVAVLILLAHIVLVYFKVNRRYWVLSLSALILLVSIKLAVEQFPY